MSDTQRQGKHNPLHYILASDRLIRLGYALDEINAYLRETSFDALVEANLEAMEERFAAEEAAASAEARERREPAGAIMRSAGRQ